MKLILWHGSDRPIDRFTGAGPDRTLHLGTRAQAEMRNRAFLHEVEVEVTRVRRSRDPGGDWSGRVRAARAAGVDAIVYLNRYEGVSAGTIERLAATGRLAGLDRLPDRAFRRLVPEAQDSWVLLDPTRARLLRRFGPDRSDVRAGGAESPGTEKSRSGGANPSRFRPPCEKLDSTFTKSGPIFNVSAHASERETEMTENDKGRGQKEVWGSVQGVVRKDSLERDEKGLAATVVGQNGAELRIKGYGETFAAMIEAAAERGGPVIFRGHVLGSKANGSVHLSVRIEGPAELNGVVSNIRRSGEGKQPYLGFWLMNEITARDGRAYRIGTGVNVYGAEADALSGLRDGDRVSLQGRDGKDGYIATSPVTVTPRDPEATEEPGM